MALLVQNGGGNTLNNTNVPKAFASNVTAGNLIIVGQTIDSASDIATAPTDSLGNTYVNATKRLGASVSSYVWYAENIAGGACTVTAHTSSTVGQTMGIAEVSGEATSSSLGAVQTNTENDTAAPSVAATAPTAGMAFGVLATTTAETITPEGTWTQIYEQESYAIMTGSHIVKVVTSGSQTASWSLGTTSNCRTCIAIFKDAAGGGGLSIPVAIKHYRSLRA